MKPVRKIFGLFLLTAIYCCAIGMGLNPDQNFKVESSGHSNKESVSAVTAKLYCHTSESETVIDNPSTNTPNSLEGPGKIHRTDKTSERIFQSQLVQYTRFSQSLLISKRKTDIIFPFHYFW